MHLSEGIKYRGSPFEIPDSSRSELPGLFNSLGFNSGAEIGVFKGRYTMAFCGYRFQMYAIDPWMAYEDFNDKHWDMVSLQEEEDAFYRIACWRLGRYRGRCKIIRKTSMEAVKDFADESLDFVYIDANHNFKYIAEDLCEWSKKVRRGGVVAGHDYIDPDYFPCHVKPVVNAYVQAFNIKRWYVLGDLDRHQSWMWFKE